MTTRKISIQGMTCNHCVGRVTETIQQLSGVKNVAVSLEEQSATVQFDKGTLTTEAIIQAVVEAGYEARETDGEEDDEPAPHPSSKSGDIIPIFANKAPPLFQATMPHRKQPLPVEAFVNILKKISIMSPDVLDCYYRECSRSGSPTGERLRR